MTLIAKKNIIKLGCLLPTIFSALTLSTAATASSIANWHFDRTHNQLDLVTDDNVQPRVQLVANPTRVVIDLPGIAFGRAQTTSKIGTTVQAVRLGQLDENTTRMVIDIAPGYTLNPRDVKVQGENSTHWSVQLATPQRITQPQPEIQEISVGRPKISPVFAGVVPLGSSMVALQPQIKALMSRYSFLKTGMFFIDLDNGNYLDMGGSSVFPAASTIKLPILVAFFQDLDAGKVSLNEQLVMREDLMTNGSGDMQYENPGKRYSALETITKMITISDNTATNMIIARLGGSDRLNQRFRSWGLKDTEINHLLADLRGTNTTSSQDMARVLALLVNNKLTSPRSRDMALDILRHTSIHTLLPAGLGPGAVIANKTGDIGFLVGDAGFITMPNGKRYLGAVFVRRPYNDTRGRDFIRQVSHLVYGYLSDSAVASTSRGVTR